MALLDAVGRAYGIRPSEIIGIPDEWIAYQFDLAAVMAGIREAEEHRKEIVQTSSEQSKYRDPSPYVTRTAKIPESGEFEGWKL